MEKFKLFIAVMGFVFFFILFFTFVFYLLGVPAEVDSYHSLFPLEPLPPPNRIHKSSNFGYITSCYKAVNNKDDLTYCLRRVHGENVCNFAINCTFMQPILNVPHF